jgi:hypothetical protein
MLLQKRSKVGVERSDVIGRLEATKELDTRKNEQKGRLRRRKGTVVVLSAF